MNFEFSFFISSIASLRLNSRISQDRVTQLLHDVDELKKQLKESADQFEDEKKHYSHICSQVITTPSGEISITNVKAILDYIQSLNQLQFDKDEHHKQVLGEYEEKMRKSTENLRMITEGQGTLQTELDQARGEIAVYKQEQERMKGELAEKEELLAAAQKAEQEKEETFEERLQTETKDLQERLEKVEGELQDLRVKMEKMTGVLKKRKEENAKLLKATNQYKENEEKYKKVILKMKEERMSRMMEMVRASDHFNE